MNENRGRGRPRKHPIVNKPLTNPEGDEFFKGVEVAGGPTDPLNKFDETWATLCGVMQIKVTENALKACLQKVGIEETPGRPDGEEGEDWKDTHVKTHFYEISEEKKCSMSCDEIFSAFLREIS